MKTIPKLLLVMLLAVVLAAPAVPAAAQQASDDVNIGSELVDKVKRSCIYIWAMSHEPYGFLFPMWIGSGVIIERLPDEQAAYAITNHHVANNTTLLQVETWDRSTYRAQLVASEPGIDCALIKITNIPPDSYEPCVLGNSDNVEPGETALAVGAPGSPEASNTERDDPSATYGLHQTTTLRVVRGIENSPRNMIQSWAYWRGPPNYLGEQVMTNCPYRLATQTAISGGNSGGPLFNAAGECIGLNHAGFAGTAQIATNLNYTIPINFCRNFVYQIINTGEYEIPWMGLDVFFPGYLKSPDNVMEFIDSKLNMDKMEVLGVRDSSPAELAGFRQGDIIREFDGRTFKDLVDLRQYVFTLDIGDTVPVVIERGREEIELFVTIGPKRNYDAEFSI